MHITRQPTISTLPETRFIGMRGSMTAAADRTAELFRGFMPRRREIGAICGNELYLLKLYPPAYFLNFDPHREFEKWAAVRVTGAAVPPRDLDSISTRGQYAVFTYTGAQHEALPGFSYIFQEWLPGSGLVLDDRPHFDVLGERYLRDDPASEEELWIPVRQGS